MEKLYWTIGEVAEMLGESVPLVRSWADGFPELVRPARNAKGNRLYGQNGAASSNTATPTVKAAGSRWTIFSDSGYFL